MTASFSRRLLVAGLSLLALGAANKPELALITAGRYLQLFPGDVELLAAATRLALANQQPRLAKEWGRALLAKRPNDGTLLASAGQDGRLLLWPVAGGPPRPLRPAPPRRRRSPC